MGRTLPWNIRNDAESKGTATSGSNVIKSTKNNDYHLTSKAVVSSRSSHSASIRNENAKRDRRSRTPSTSPPPAPPDIENMREGFDADDAYMMVEDEFQAVASSFTAHLHHAEYKRLMRDAKAARQTQIPELSSQMSNETKMRLKQATLTHKQSAGLDGMTRSLSGNVNDDTVANEEDDASDPWTGTSLAGLMTANSQSKVSLKGLDRISSSTKAAQGYGPPKGRHLNGALADDESQHQLSKTKADSDEKQMQQHFAIPSSKRNRIEESVGSGKPELQNGRKEDLIDNSSDTWDRSTRRSRPQVQSKEANKRRNRIDELDDFDEDLFDQVNALHKSKMRATSKAKGDSKKVKRGNSRLDEVPVFLV